MVCHVARVLLATCLLASPLLADHFTVELTAQVGDVKTTAHTEIFAPGSKPKVREVIHMKVGDRVLVHWTLTSVADKTFDNVLVHFFAVEEEKLNQAQVPKLNKGVVAESALTMDFKTKDKATGKLTFSINKPGLYLVRVETIGAAVGDDQHEHYAALDVVVK